MQSRDSIAKGAAQRDRLWQPVYGPYIIPEHSTTRRRGEGRAPATLKREKKQRSTGRETLESLRLGFTKTQLINAIAKFKEKKDTKTLIPTKKETVVTSDNFEPLSYATLNGKTSPYPREMLISLNMQS